MQGSGENAGECEAREAQKASSSSEAVEDGGDGTEIICEALSGDVLQVGPPMLKPACVSSMQ